MPTYAIGDVQGCYTALQQLLKEIQFDPKNDKLWFTGDLINRGPQSLETLRFVKSLNEQNQAITVLGNHDLTLLAVGYEKISYQPQHHTFLDILQAPDKEELLNWLRYQPLLHTDNSLGFTIVHAGLLPQWDLSLATSLAQEVEIILKGQHFLELFSKLYGNEPDTWDPTLKGWDRIRLIVNCFTRLRFCTPEGRIELNIKESAQHAPSGYFPWYAVPNRLSHDQNIIFGHWASLKGQCNIPRVFALDTGCVWGNALTAMRLEDEKSFSISCQAAGK